MYTQKLSFSSSSDDDDSSDDDAFNDPINSLICDKSTEPPIAPPSLSRTRALNLNTSQSLINHRSDSVTISEYERRKTVLKIQ